MFKPDRNQRLSEFSPDKNLWSIALLGLLFLAGLVIAFKSGAVSMASYLGLWAVSYFIIYAGTCRYCVYFGKKCPIPLEGSCVNKFFDKKDSDFGWIQLFWAAIVYLLRILVPMVIIINKTMFTWGLAYGLILALFCIVHLRISGCPNCINVKCPLNPDHAGQI